LAKELGYDAIHDTVHEMARDEARHGKAFKGLLERYFGWPRSACAIGETEARPAASRNETLANLDGSPGSRRRVRSSHPRRSQGGAYRKSSPVTSAAIA
jgi:hypothetical protein